MKKKMPDPRVAAEKQADYLMAAGLEVLEHGVRRYLGDAPWLGSMEDVLRGIDAFHQERMAKVPPAIVYPEAAPWVDYVRAVDRELMARVALTPRQLAVYRSFGEYVMFRGVLRAGLARTEKCRVFYHPATDHGAMHTKNVDDPVPPGGWRPDRTMPRSLPCSRGLVWDGVGSGLHLDDEPDEIFPLPFIQMFFHHANDVPAGIDFLKRYCKFHGGCNFVLHDDQRRSVAVEKCSRNFVEFYPPDPQSGFTHVSGMVCRNPNSPLGRYQKAKRDQYRRLFHLPDNGCDAVFWDACDRADRLLADTVRAMGPTPRRDDVLKLLTTPWPDGLCKTGAKLHPDQAAGEYTFVVCASLLDERTYYRWQRDENLAFPATPEIRQY